MKKSVHVFLALLTLPMCVAIASAQQPIDPRVADLVRAGQVRVAMFPPQFTKNTATGELGGWGLELARALGARLRVEAGTILKRGPDGVLECLKADLCDAGFLVNSPNWADVVDF